MWLMHFAGQEYLVKSTRRINQSSSTYTIYRKHLLPWIAVLSIPAVVKGWKTLPQLYPLYLERKMEMLNLQIMGKLYIHVKSFRKSNLCTPHYLLMIIELCAQSFVAPSMPLTQ